MAYSEEIARQKAEKHNIRPELLQAMIHAESSGRPRAVSTKGARGLLQIMPATAEQYGVRPDELHDPETNLETGARHFSYLLNLYEGDEKLALAAYNAGQGNVAKYGGVPPFRETEKYVEKVMTLAPPPGQFEELNTPVPMHNPQMPVPRQVHQVRTPYDPSKPLPAGYTPEKMQLAQMKSQTQTPPMKTGEPLPWLKTRTKPEIKELEALKRSGPPTSPPNWEGVRTDAPVIREPGDMGDDWYDQAGPGNEDFGSVGDYLRDVFQRWDDLRPFAEAMSQADFEKLGQVLADSGAIVVERVPETNGFKIWGDDEFMRDNFFEHLSRLLPQLFGRGAFQP